MATAFEMITTRQSYYASAAIGKYYAVQIHTDGKLIKADGTRPFVGICEYPAAAANDMVTVVKGTFPALSAEEITAGDLLTIDSGNPGKFRIADTEADQVYGAALTGAAAGDLFTIMMNDVALAIAGA